ncbi:hypothetical protein [Streptomyces sp. NPDC048638]|uniref:hypothetical protein n=1 Tax=Streptomyces sp. NPDC048638 TaxID=3365580 RepID=UPI00371E9624
MGEISLHWYTAGSAGRRTLRRGEIPAGELILEVVACGQSPAISRISPVSPAGPVDTELGAACARFVGSDGDGAGVRGCDDGRMNLVLVLAVGMVLGYLIRCGRPARRLVQWAQLQETGTAAWWPAQPVLAIAVVARFAAHPRRSVRNVRSWQQEPRVQAPRRDPDWAARRGGR